MVKPPYPRAPFCSFPSSTGLVAPASLGRRGLVPGWCAGPRKKDHVLIHEVPALLLTGSSQCPRGGRLSPETPSPGLFCSSDKQSGGLTAPLDDGNILVDF